MYTNIRIPDSVVRNEDYAKRAVELGHGIISTMEHGTQGRYIEGYELAQKYNLQFLFGTEAYWVKDRLESDNTNAHICIFAKTEFGRQSINDILAEANITGFYYQPRIDLDLIMSLPKDDVWITSACVAFWKYNDDNIVKQLHDYFKHNFYLEVQYHQTEKQTILNKHIIDLSNRWNVPIIMGCDSHYINNETSWERDEYIKSKGIFYDDEVGWLLDYPDGDIAHQRFIDQAALTTAQIEEAMDNTNVFLDVHEYDNPCFNFDIKMPTLYPNSTQEEKDKVYSNLVWQQWEEKKHKIQQDKWNLYENEIQKEINDVIITKHADYFLLDYEIVKKAVEKGGLITDTGRGSGVSYYTNNLLGLTKIDRIGASVRMYPERFISPTRILESKSLADLDLNCGNPEVFAEAQTEVFAATYGEEGKEFSYPMLAYGTMKIKSAWKMYAKAKDIDFELANAVSEQIEKYETALKHAEEDEKDEIDVYDYVDEQYHDFLRYSENYQGIISDIKPHSCLTENTLILTKDGYKKIIDIQKGDTVISQDNTYQTVLNVMSRKINEYYNVKIGGQILEVTGNHPMYVISNIVRSSDGKIKHRTEPYWKPVEELQKGDLVGFAINQESFIPHYENVPIDNQDFWWIVGRYLGDGYCSSFKRKYGFDKRINFSCHNDEISEITDKLKSLGLNYHYNNREEKSIEIAFYNHYIWDFLQMCGKYAEGKYLPGFVFDLPVDLLKCMVDGYLSADGNITNNEYSFKTTSMKLAYGMQACIHKTYHLPCSIQISQPSKGIIKGKEFVRRISYKGRFTINPTSKVRHIFKDNHIWIRYHSKEAIRKYTTVYNIEVENSHSYTANNAIVHNCGYLIYQGNIRKEIGLIKIKTKTSKKEVICTIMDGKWAEDYKFLKNDLLKVSVVELIKKTYQRIGIEPHEENELLEICKDNQKVWDVYKNGWVLGINQVEQNSSRHRVIKYQPKNISELCAFVAAVRPGFKSMYSIFENRERFTYDIPAFDKLIQTPEMPNSFLLYQEMAMAALNFAGIPMSECYDVIKNIAKKRAEKVQKYKDQFIVGFKERLIEIEHIDEQNAQIATDKVWHIISDSCRYSFNASHSYSVAMDSLYGAYLKSYYPLQFYEVFLNILDAKGSQKDRMSATRMEAELAYKIRFEPLRFRQDNRKITADEKNYTMWNSLSALKGFGEGIAHQLYGLKDNQYDTFVDLLIDLEEKSIMGVKIAELIKIQYFNEFGNNGKLLTIYEELTSGKSKYSRKHKEATKLKRIEALRQIEQELPNEQIPIVDQMKFENDILGYVQVTCNVDKRYVYIMDVDTKFSPRFECYCLNNGKTESMKISKKTFSRQPISKDDIIYINICKSKPKKKYENGKFIDIEGTKEWWIEDYKIIVDKMLK